jgi:hypothetical protein
MAIVLHLITSNTVLPLFTVTGHAAMLQAYAAAATLKDVQLLHFEMQRVRIGAVMISSANASSNAAVSSTDYRHVLFGFLYCITLDRRRSTYTTKVSPCYCTNQGKCDVPLLL